MGGEHVAGPGCPECHWEWLPCLTHEAEGAREHRKRGMSFVEMTDFSIDAKFFEHAPASDSENDLLGKARPRFRWVEMSRDAAVGRGIEEIVAVQQIQRHLPHTSLPDPQ